MFEMDFKVLRKDKGEIIGFSLISRPHTASEVFCDTFPHALRSKPKQADINIVGEEIVFDHPTCYFQGRCAFPLTEEEKVALNDILNGDRQIFPKKSPHRARVKFPNRSFFLKLFTDKVIFTN